MSKCKHAHHNHGSTADIWTKFSAIGEGTASLISDAYWLGGLFDLATQLDDDGFGLSWYGMGFGTAIALITSVGTAYSHSVLNLNHQPDNCASVTRENSIQESQASDSLLNHPRLSALQKAALIGDFISHTGDIAGPITFVINLGAKETLPIWAKALVECGATLFGGLSSIANVRTCRHNMLKLNEVKMATQEPTMVLA